MIDWSTILFVRNLTSNEQIYGLYKIFVNEYYCHLLPSFPSSSIVASLSFSIEFYELRSKRMEYLLNKLHSYFFVKQDERFDVFFSEDYIPSQQEQSILADALKLFKTGISDATRVIKNRIQVKSNERSNSETQIEFGDTQKDLLAYETDLKHFGGILSKVMEEITVIKKAIEDSLYKKSDNNFIEDTDTLPFKDEYLRFKELSIQIKNRELEFLPFLKKKFFLKMKVG